MNMCFLTRIIIAFAFTLIACNAVFASSPGPLVLVDSFINQEPPWNIGATSEDSVIAEFSPDGMLIIQGRGKMMDFDVQSPWEEMCMEKNKLSKVFIDSGVTHIGDRAFRFCNDFDISIPNSVTSIGVGAFVFSGLTSIAIPGSVTSIGESAFYNNNLSSVTIPNSVTSIGEEAFFYNENLKAISVAPGNNAYSSKDGVLYDKNFSTLIQYSGGQSETATVPNGVTSIGDYAFAYHKNLISVSIPNSVTSIGDFAFSHSEKLTSIIIPGSVTSIGKGAFYNSGLTSITILNPTPPSLFADTLKSKYFYYYDVDKETCILYVPKGSIDAYRKADGWKDFSFKNIEPIE